MSIVRNKRTLESSMKPAVTHLNQLIPSVSKLLLSTQSTSTHLNAWSVADSLKRSTGSYFVPKKAIFRYLYKDYWKHEHIKKTSDMLLELVLVYVQLDITMEGHSN